MIGDERTKNYKWNEYNMFPSQEFKHVANANVKSLCQYIDHHINGSYDLVLIFAFHYDLCHFQYDSKFGYEKMVLSLRKEFKEKEILSTVIHYHQQWKTNYPDVFVIWTLPFPPDFYGWNHEVIKNFPNQRQNIFDQHEFTKRYYEHVRALSHMWHKQVPDIPVFPLNDVLFMYKSHYKKTFQKKGEPMYPAGFIADNMVPSSMMVILFAYLLIRYLVDNKVFRHYSLSKISMSTVEEKLLKYHPSSEKYLSKSSHHHSSHKHRKKRRSRSSTPPFTSESDTSSFSPVTKKYLKSQNSLEREYRPKSPAKSPPKTSVLPR